MTENTQIAGLAAAVLEAQPFSRLLGAELITATAHEAEIALTVRECHLQQYEIVHGGVIAYLADNALTFAGGIALQGEVVTSQMNIHYLRPARAGRLIARAQIVSLQRSSAMTRCEVFEQSGTEQTMVAAATGLIRQIGSKAEDRGRS